MNKFKEKISEATQVAHYEFAKTPEGLTTVTLEPLLEQVKQVYHNAISVDTKDLSEPEQRAVKFTLDATNQVYNFISSLLTEAEIKFTSEGYNETKH
jgi:hypothetical protein